MPFDRQDQHALSTGCAKVVYVREYKGVQGSTGEYRGVQGSTGEYRRSTRAGSTPDTKRRLRAVPELYTWLGIDWLNFTY